MVAKAGECLVLSSKKYQETVHIKLRLLSPEEHRDELPIDN